MPEQGADAADAHLWANRRQLEWAPTIANGAAVIALANIIANSNNQDRALDALTWPIALHGLGLCLSSLGVYYILRSFQHQTNVVRIAHQLHDALNPLIHRLNEAIGDDRLQLSAELQLLMPWVQDQQPRYARSLAAYRMFGRIGRTLMVAAIALCALGMVALLAGHKLGYMRLS